MPRQTAAIRAISALEELMRTLLACWPALIQPSKPIDEEQLLGLAPSPGFGKRAFGHRDNILQRDMDYYARYNGYARDSTASGRLFLARSRLRRYPGNLSGGGIYAFHGFSLQN